ncbi:MAG: hypothetical protein ABR517_14620, partial [Thermoanaerobaculia bacterium]
MPSAVGQPLVYCHESYCLDSDGNPQPTWQYSPPLKSFKGRFLDSSRTRDYQAGWGYRTLRAKGMALVPEINRAYFMLGETLAAYNLDTFMSSKLGSPLQILPMGFAEAGLTREEYLPWNSAVYPEESGSGWQIEVGDGQQRLYDFDYDDRGYVYLAYSFFGWGIVQDIGGLALVAQDFDTKAVRVRVVKADASRYLAVVQAGPDSIVYDVTNPSAPQLLRRINAGSLLAMEKSGGSSPFIAFNNEESIKIYSANDLIHGVASGTINDSGFYSGLGTDGTRFFAVRKITKTTSEIITIGRSSGSWEIEARKDLPNMPKPYGVNFNEGYLTVWGAESDGVMDVRLYKAESGG